MYDDVLQSSSEGSWSSLVYIMVSNGNVFCVQSLLPGFGIVDWQSKNNHLY